tara:strand:+ start:6559 stop:6948 length:390 start_codon:yes stop_codon:yes gene_type:complete
MAEQKNFVGGGTTGNAVGGAEKGFDPSGFISMGFNLIAGTIMGMSNAKKQRELQEKLSKLSLKQQKELEERLQDVQGQIAKQTALYQAVAVVEGAKLIDGRKKLQLLLFGVLGVGLLSLVALSIVYKRK